MDAPLLPEPPPLPPNAALFVDFDGTLAPLAPRPQDVRVPEWVLPTLARLQRRQGGAVAVVSGRPIDQLDHFLAPLKLPAAGVHGVQRRTADGRLELHSATPPTEVVGTAQALARRHAGLLFEPKPSGFVLHYRAVPQLATLCHTELQQAMPADDSGWQLMHGHSVVEFKQRAVSKATALWAFMGEPVFAGRLPVYVGDDVTDEDGIAAAQAAGGFGVRVGPAMTQARYRLDDAAAVGRWLGGAALDQAAAGEARP